MDNSKILVDNYVDNLYIIYKYNNTKVDIII